MPKLEGMDILRVDKEENGTMDIRVAYNNKLVGCFMVSEDGFYNFWPADNTSGYYSSDILIELGRKLEVINQPWADNIDQYFSNANYIEE
jgi:hypothetical protein